MKKQKLYEPDDKMISLIKDNYDILHGLGRFGINLGFGDRTVRDVCESQGVDTRTFLAVVNYTINGFRNTDEMRSLSVPTLMHYLIASHEYFINYELPFVRKELQEALDEKDNLARLILKLYDEYSHSIQKHMRFEEKTVFPYVEQLQTGEANIVFNIETFSKYHDQTNQKLRELKDIILKYLPSDTHHNNKLTAALYDIYNCETWLTQHSEVEDNIFIPAIRQLEQQTVKKDVAMRISHMISKGSETNETISDREKEIVIGVVQGMTNQEIADSLNISINTVTTHRRNIARKLQIHSPAGLTIYAIVNNWVDIGSVNL